jgi:hypothetical protein
VGADVLAPLDRTQRVGDDAGTPQVAWRSAWRLPTDSLRALAASRCEVAAAFRFMRTPVWQAVGDSLLLADVRYGVGRGFNSVMLPARGGACTLRGKWVPGWREPRADLLRASAAMVQRPGGN